MRKSGFTLIELMMASVILAILAAIVIPNFTRSQLRAKESEVKSVAFAFQMAIEDYKATPGQEGIKPATAADLTTVQTSYLPYNVQTKRNPFGNGAGYYGQTEIVFGPGAGVGGRVYYSYTSQTVQYTIVAYGGDTPNAELILTLIEGQ